MPEIARPTNLLNEIIVFRLRSDHLESDSSEFAMLKNRHAKTTGKPLDNDLLITLLMQKTTGSLQTHLWLNVRSLNMFSEALEPMHAITLTVHANSCLFSALLSSCHMFS